MNRNDMRSGDHAFRAGGYARSVEKADLMLEIRRIEGLLMGEMTANMRTMYQRKLAEVQAQYQHLVRGAI